MSVSRSARTLRLTPFLLLFVFFAWAETAQAGIGLSFTLPDSSSTRFYTRPVPRGISSFGKRAIIKFNPAIQVEMKWDSTYSQVSISKTAQKGLIAQPDILDRDTYVAQRLAYDVRGVMVESRLKSYKVQSQRSTGEGLAIDLPYRIKSKTFRRLFGGDNVGVRVSGNIQINGNLRRQKFAEQQANQQNTNTSFRIDMVQRFTITGKIGQKVEVKVDQDSERLFDFENSLKLTYTGDDDEIIKKVEAGNVSLNLATKLATFSGRNTGLFGLKTEAKVGALSLTGIASLERGQKNRLSPNSAGGQQVNRFTEKNFLANQYFWLTSVALAGDSRPVPNYRDQYRVYSNRNHVSLPPADQILDLELFVGVEGQTTNSTQTRGRAVALQFIQDLDDDTFAQDQNHVESVWKKLTVGVDYTVDKRYGFIRLTNPLQDQALACGFRLQGTEGDDINQRTFGDLVMAEGMKLILLKPKQPSPSDSTWNLMFRHVYSLGARDIDKNSFTLKILRDAASDLRQQETPPNSSASWLTYFRFDMTGESGSGNPDDKVDDDPLIIDYAKGELHFLDLTPFAPSGYFENGTEVIWDLCTLTGSNGDSSFCAPWLYNSNPISYATQPSPFWSFNTQFKGQTSIFQLGPLVLEGSEEVTLNGQALQRNTDYSIDYMSGELRILSERAKAPGAALDITYESGRVFQLDKTTLLGARAEYDLWQDAYIGGMVLYLNQKTLDKRVRIGNEPIRNTLWDLNSSMKFKPSILSRMVEALPLVHTTAASELQFDAEVARVFPNPNSLENSRTGDFNGLAYLDDFEGARRAIPLGMSRRQWSVSSVPLDPNIDSRRGRIRWYNPQTRDQVPVKEVFPEREVNSQVANTLQSMWVSFDPDATNGEPAERSWGGFMRYLGEGYSDQSQSQYLEFWIQLPPENRLASDARMIVDLGTISEDALPNDTLNTEDWPLPGRTVTPTGEFGDGVLKPEEDTGIDGKRMADPGDSALWNGVNRPPIPSWDDWDRITSGNGSGKINGYEGNLEDEGGGYPDTEDLNGNDNLDIRNDYFSYTINLSYQNPYIVGGQTNINRWRLFRIPINVDDPRIRRKVGTADLTNIRWARMYLTGFDRPDSIQIVQLDIVANEWLPVTSTLDTTEYVTPAVINSHENPGYMSPPGVQGEIDPITELRQREQSLVLKINELSNVSGDTSLFFVAKNLYQEYNLLEYKHIKMFVHGGDSLEAANFPDDMFQLILRFALNSEINNNYYDVITNVKPGWDPTNFIDVTMNDLSMMKSRRDAAGVSSGTRFSYAYNADGDSLAIKGNPTLSRVGFLALGVRLRDRYAHARNKEIWVDELRVSDIYKESGTAAELNTGITLADFATITGGYRVMDADFHNVNQRINASQSSSESWRANVQLNMHKFALERWGFRLPFSMSYSEGVTTPRIIPNTDTRINPDNAPDSIRAFQKAIQLRASYSKTGNSKNPLVRYTLEPLTASWDYSQDERSDYTIRDEHGTQIGAQVAYALPTSKGNGIKPLWWMQGAPFLKWMGNPVFFYKPTRMQVGLQAARRTGVRENRPTYSVTDSGIVETIQRTNSFAFTTTRSFSTAFQPFGPLTLDYSRSHKGDHDSTGTWDKLLQFDFGRRSNITQNASATYSPQLLKWLKPSISYNTGYTWTHSNFTLIQGQQIGNQRAFGTDVQLDFAQIFGRGGGNRGDRSRERERRGREHESESGMRLPEESEASGKEGEGKPPEERPGGDPLEPPAGRMEMPPPLEHEEKKPDEGKPDSAGVKPAASADSAQTAAKPSKSPLKAFGEMFSPVKKGLLMLDPIVLSYDNTTSHGQSGLLGQPKLAYQFGLTQNHGLNMAEGFEASPVSRRGQEVTARTGIKPSRDLRFTFSHAYSQSKDVSTSTSTGSHSQTTFWLMSKGSGLKTTIPFVDVSADLSGLERIKFLSKLAKTASISSALSNRMQENWQTNESNVTAKNFTQQWNPLLGVNISWKSDIETSIRYTSSTTFGDNIGSRNKTRQSDNGITATVTYTLKTGFKLPLFFMKPIHVQNSTSFSLNGDYRKQKNESTETGSDVYVTRGETTSWSLQPRATYTFSNTVQGEAYVQMQETKDEITSRKSKLFEFGIRVNISIRG